MGMFGVWNRKSMSYWQLSPSRDMLAIQLWDRHSFSGNLKMEIVGIGLRCYCIVFVSSLDFYSKLKLILYSLPLDQMFLYAVDARLEGPFL